VLGTPQVKVRSLDGKEWREAQGSGQRKATILTVEPGSVGRHSREIIQSRLANVEVRQPDIHCDVEANRGSLAGRSCAACQQRSCDTEIAYRVSHEFQLARASPNAGSSLYQVTLFRHSLPST